MASLQITRVRKASTVGFWSSIRSLLFEGHRKDKDVYTTTVCCSRCGEEIPVRIDLSRELTPSYGEEEGSYYVRKGVVGSGETRCFQTIELHLTFDAQRRILSREISGGAFVEGDDSLDPPD